MLIFRKQILIYLMWIFVNIKFISHFQSNLSLKFIHLSFPVLCDLSFLCKNFLPVPSGSWAVAFLNMWKDDSNFCIFFWFTGSTFLLFFLFFIRGEVSLF